jgi:DNA recombination protein RmuC
VEIFFIIAIVLILVTILYFVRNTYEKRIVDLKSVCEQQVVDLKASYEKQIREIKGSYERQIADVKENSAMQLQNLREMNKEQIDSQLNLIREQMKTTSEAVLKERQKELGERNNEQVSKIIDPLKQSLNEMKEALNTSKEQQREAMTRLDATIKLNMEKSASLGETADRLTRALTGEVKVQGNFGELKLKQLLEDLELKEGEQFDTQETLRDKNGKIAKGDDGKGLIPDFILHFPNNRHVVVDSKMSLTDYERYMNAEEGSEEKSLYLKAHIDSVRAQVKRLAKKEYTKYLPEGYNRLSFAIMYIPVEGALNLALLNDTGLWREAYDEGVLILGPQTMYMNLRVLEMMWTQVRQLKNQQTMVDAANTIIERVQEFGTRFQNVESSMHKTIELMSKLKISTADGGKSIITAARNLIKAGAKENKNKKSLNDIDDTLFLESDETILSN